MKKTTIILAVISATLLFAFHTAPKASYAIDTEQSTLIWTGFHLAKSYEHTGTIQIKSGSIDVENGQVTGGQFVIDMNSISNADLKDASKKAKLEGHLKSEEFFAVSDFPEAKLVITSNEKKNDNAFTTTADLTIRGITKSITFESTVKDSDDKVTLIATIMVPRTDFKVMYGWSVENVVLSSEFKLDVEVIANK